MKAVGIAAGQLYFVAQPGRTAEQVAANKQEFAAHDLDSSI